MVDAQITSHWRGCNALLHNGANFTWHVALVGILHANWEQIKAVIQEWAELHIDHLQTTM